MSEEAVVEASKAEEAPKRRRRRWPWILLLLAVGTAVGLRVALPLLVERGAAYGSRYYLGLPIRIDNADFSLLDGTVVLEGVSVGARPDDVTPKDAALAPPVIDPTTALLHWDRISAHLSWGDLRDRTVHLTELSLASPSVRVERESDGKIDPLRYARPLAPEQAAEPEEAESGEPSPPWKIAVDRFELRGPDVKIADPASGQNLLEFSLEQFLLEEIAVRGSDFALGGIGIEGPVLRVRRDLVLAKASATSAASATPAEAVPAAAAAPATPPATPPTAAPAAAAATAPVEKAGYRIAKIDIERAKFTWVTDQGPLDVALKLKASGLTMDQGQHFPVDLELQIGEGKIGVNGAVGILPPAYSGKFTWQGLPFPPLLLASLPQFAPWLKSADSSGDLTINVDLASGKAPPSLRIAGRTTVETLAIADPKGEEAALGWKQLEVVAREIVVPLSEEGKPNGTPRVALDSVKLVEPKIRYSRPSPALDALLGRPVAAAEPPAAKADAKADAKRDPKAAPPKPAKAKDAKAATPPAEPAPPPGPAPVDMSIAALELSAGDFELVDNTVKPTAHPHIRDLSVTAANVHFPPTTADAIRIRANLPEASTLTIDGELKPGNNGDFTIVLSKLDLPGFSPYAAAAGASLDAGQVTLKTKVKIRAGKTQVDNDLLLRKFGVSLHDPGSFERSFGVPIDLALALLRDPSGNINLTIPLKVDEKGTATVAVSTVIASALRQALVGALTSPLKMLGAAFGEGGGLGIEPIGFAPGGPDPLAGQQGRVDGLVDLLSKRPNVQLVLKGRTGPADRPLVAEQILIELSRDGKDLPDVEGSGFLARRRIGGALAKKSKGQAPELSAEDQALYERYVAAVVVPPERLRALSVSRGEAVRALLLGKGVAGGRVAVGEPEADGSPAVVVGLKTQ